MPADDFVPGILLGSLAALVGGALVSESCRRRAFLRMLLPGLLLWRFGVFLFLVLWALPYYAEGRADAIAYHIKGLEAATAIRAGAWDRLRWEFGTPAFVIWTGLLYAPFGGNLTALYFVSMFVGLGAAISLYKAFALFGAPRQTRVYGLMMFFLPSYSMWTSIHGKDSWVGLGLGLSAHGYGLWLRGKAAKGVARLAAGMLVILVFRPHIAFLVAVAFLVSQVLFYGTAKAASWVQGTLTLVVLAAMLLGVGHLAKGFVGLQEVSVGAALARNDVGARGNAYGGSAVEYRPALSVTEVIRGLPAGIVKVLFRPFLWEAHNFNAALAAVENAWLVLFSLRRLGSLGRLVKHLIRQPYWTFSTALAIELVLVYSSTTNLGLLSRMRAQLLPFFLVPLVGFEDARCCRVVPGRVPHPSGYPNAVNKPSGLNL